ncbi:MAG TPA: RHS repeat-associated core domain-containing protein, partial [Pyrinomonadaceae bacterium]|nr:RHS repeat-associated core domain-containing protein [Pyrinomonadaceae bacterium]
QYTDGLVYQDETYGPGNPGPLLQKSLVTWEPGAYESPRPARVEATDERDQKTVVEADYGASYNQATEVRNYDYGGLNLLRVTKTQYENSPEYTSRHIFNLPTQIEVFAANGTTRVSRAEYTYDGGTLADTPDVIQHEVSHNPYSPEEGYEQCDWDPYTDSYNCYWVSTNPYDPATNYRGNVTQVKTYADAAGLTNPITETITYDITGNPVTTSAPCCEQTSLTYTSATQYAYPTSQKRGSATDATKQVTVSAAYSFNTGLQLSSTDANGRTTQATYFATNLRPQKVTLPTGAYTLFAYDDAAMSLTSTSYLYGGTVIASKSVKRLNGMGEIAQEEALTRENSVDYWDVVETVYDEMGRVKKQSMPYRSGQTPQWSETFYDAVGRVVMTKAPDGSESKAFYNETTRPTTAAAGPGQTIRVVDAWGKERWGRQDSLGRLVEIVEPDPNGNGLVQNSDAGTASTASLSTKYTYDTLGNLTLVVQGSQQRKFKYDSLGRLTHQKMAERSATLNDAGTFVTTGGLWSDVFTYDTRSNLVTRTDARGAKATFNYNNDPLNRLQSVSYTNTAADSTILAAPPVTYTYMTTGDRARVDTVTTANVSTEDYEYDAEGRIRSISLTLASRPSYPMETEYTFDSLDRLTDVRYPAQYGVLNSPRKVVHHDYDVASRLSGLKVDAVSHASSVAYNPASQITSLKVGTGTNQLTESYTYETLTGLLSGQKVQRGTTTLMDLSYDYLRTATTSGRSGQLTKITNNLDAGRGRAYEYDALGRLKKATGTSATPWSQTYTYDRYGNRQTVTAAGNADNGSAMPRDGYASLTYAAATNRISTAGWQYDAAGNQTRAQTPGGGWQKYQYDAAGRLVKVTDDLVTQNLAVYTYGSSNKRLISTEGNLNTYYAWSGEAVAAEYHEVDLSGAVKWAKSYVYLGGRLLSTITPGATVERVEYHHPDRLGTRLVTNNADTTSFEQVTLPFGMPLDAESTGASNRRFTSYDRSTSTGLDYAINRQYDSKQGRFTQADPIGMGAVSLNDPQTLNLYAYCGNDPVNRVDPNGLFFGKLFKWIGKALKWVAVAIGVFVAVVAVIAFTQGAAAPLVWGLLGLSAANFGLAFGPPWLKRVLSARGLGGFNVGPGGTAVFNQHAGSGLGGGSGALSRYINHFQDEESHLYEGGIVRIEIWALGPLVPIVTRIGPLAKKAWPHLKKAGGWALRGLASHSISRLAANIVKNWVADSLIRQHPINSGPANEMLRDAITRTKELGSTAEQRALLFDRYAKKITAEGHPWTATSGRGIDGSYIFTGGGGPNPNVLVIRPDGAIFTGKFMSSINQVQVMQDIAIPIYENMKPQ